MFFTTFQLKLITFNRHTNYHNDNAPNYNDQSIVVLLIYLYIVIESSAAKLLMNYEL